MITNGTIEFNRHLRTGDNEHKDAKVSLSFTVAENENAHGIARGVGNIAVAQALAMVGEMPWVERTPEPRATFPASVSVMAEPQAKAEGLTNKGVMDDAQPGADVGAAAVQEEVEKGPETITDKRLVDELTAKNARLLNAAADDQVRQTVPQKLHALVASFVPPPAKVQSIPADQRAAFLEQLHAL